MKKILNHAAFLILLTTAYFIAGCETISQNNAEIATSRKEMMLTDAGFRARTVTTSKMQQQVAALAANKVSAVRNNGKLYYVYPTTKKDQILVGNQAQFDAYKAGLGARRTSSSAQIPPEDPFWVEETAGPGDISTETFEGLSPANP